MQARGFVLGPTYREMLDPSTLSPEQRQEVAAARGNELAPAQLYRISWSDERSGQIRVLRLPPELTGVEANILLLVGKHMPTGSLKVGPAYSGIMEAELDGRIRPGEVTLVAPSSGNFGIGVAWVARLKGYRALVLVPEGCSEERCERIRSQGAELEMVPCSGHSIEPMLQLAHQRYANRPGYLLLDQFAMPANYRFHRYVTGRSAIEAAAGFGDGRVAAFVSAPGSAGTLAAGDEIKARFPEAVVVAVEPEECAVLRGHACAPHHVEGVGDGVVNLIHNVLNTDYLARVSDEDCLQGLRVIQEGPETLTRILGVPEPAANGLMGLLGPSSVCNILGAIQTAAALGIKAGRNVVTVAPDGYDRYAAAMADFEARSGLVDQAILRQWTGQIFRWANGYDLHDLRPAEEKQRLFAQKEATWSALGYSREYLEELQTPAFWEREAALVADYDRRLREARDAARMGGI